MKRWLPLSVLLFAVIAVASTLVPSRNQTDFDLVGFGRLPVLVNGRIKPFDTIARSSLLVLQGRQRVTLPNGAAITPVEWLLDVTTRPDIADAYQTIEIVHPDLLTLFGVTPADGAGGKRFSFEQIKAHVDDFERQAQLADSVASNQRSSFQRAVLQLFQNLLLYDRLKYSLTMPDSPDYLAELKRFQEILPAGAVAAQAKAAGKPYNEQAYAQAQAFEERFDFLAKHAELLPIPPGPAEANQSDWKQVGRSLLDTFGTGTVNPNVMVYAGLAGAWRQHMPKEFNEIIALYRDQLATRFAPQLAKCHVETTFNSSQPFYTATWLYVLAFLLAVVSWLKWPDALGRSAFWLVVLAFALTTVGIGTRMWLEARPPVTNLYSSALFVGWVAVALCIVLESIFKNAVGSVTAGLVGLGTLIIAHHLALGGDTMEMMRAVLDSNFWLATHVVTVTVGYGATYLAGFLALIYIFRGVFTKSLDRATADSLDRMVYGIVCFATLFSFVGTVLGGIWADQSWGRFWGWDPKENGALIIVLWNALILHARWGEMVGQRGLMCLTVFGNIVTSWSWFGVNMLGVGLHSYGFMDQAFWWLLAFVLSQVVIILIASLPLSKWRSFAGKAA
jgi:ABC-type transport system involved in cytochrome c biogenesis permease subunit